MNRYLIIVLTILAYSSALEAQQAHFLDTIVISDQRLSTLSHGHRVQAVDSASRLIWQSGNLADLLASETDVFMKHYGSGSLATSSLRGGGAAHTSFIWNGVRMQSPMNGQNDWALLPVFFLDNIQVQYGGSAAMYGSGSVGGAIHSSSSPQLGKGLKASVHETLGSFGFHQHGTDLGYGAQSWSLRSRMFLRHSENDFFIPSTNRHQPHAALRQIGWMGEGSWQPGSRDLLQVWAWTQHSHRQIPPTLSAEQSLADQEDQHLRLAATWIHQRKRGVHTVRTAINNESLIFSDPTAGIFSANMSRQWMLEAESLWPLGPNQQIQLGLHQIMQQAQADGYGENLPRQYRLAGFASWQLWSKNKHHRLYANLRQGTVDGTLIPLTPSAGGQIKISDMLMFRGQAGRTFRLPTFNDLYWTPGGNSQLLPELGWNQEIGVEFSPFQGRSSSRFPAFPPSLLASFTVFNQTIDNWILWRPGPAFWYPENVRKVWSRGIESNVTFDHQIGDWGIHAVLGHTWTRATVQRVSIPRDKSLGQQLIYTPEHQSRASISIRWKNYIVRYGHQTTGRRYTATDGSDWLEPFHIGNLFFSRRWNFPSWTLQGALRCDNLWNVTYQVMDNRPMPPRSYQISLDIFFHPAKTSKTHS